MYPCSMDNNYIVVIKIKITLVIYHMYPYKIEYFIVKPSQVFPVDFCNVDFIIRFNNLLFSWLLQCWLYFSFQ